MNQDENPPGRDGNAAAEDISRLYSKTKGILYRDFARRRDLDELGNAVVDPPSSVAESPEQDQGDASSPLPAEHGDARAEGARRPALAIYSIAGGVGKTTLCANLGRALCLLGEEVLLVDASAGGLLPLHFGASERRTGLRTFQAPDARHPALRMLAADAVTGTWLEEQAGPAMLAAQRTLFDLSPGGASLPPQILKQILGMCSAMLVPLLPDLNSVMTIDRLEASLQAMRSGAEPAPTAFYIFRQTDGERRGQERAREIAVHECGDRLLPIAIRNGPAGEALDAGMPLADYAPASQAARDYWEIALWLQSAEPVHSTAPRPGRWRER